MHLKCLIFSQYPLLAAMLTSRPFDEVVERSQSRSLDASAVSGGGGGGDEAVIRGYAQRYIREIVQMLDIVSSHCSNVYIVYILIDIHSHIYFFRSQGKCFSFSK